MGEGEVKWWWWWWGGGGVRVKAYGHVKRGGGLRLQYLNICTLWMTQYCLHKFFFMPKYIQEDIVCMSRQMISQL